MYRFDTILVIGLVWAEMIFFSLQWFTTGIGANIFVLGCYLVEITPSGEMFRCTFMASASYELTIF